MDYSCEKDYLRQVLELARARKGFCAPNPAVGALIVKNAEIIAIGQHWSAGCPHAEADALAKLGNEAAGATIYVTLEPCCHWGKTPPCTELIIRHKIARVVYGYKDPNLLMNGKGEQALLAAGISCDYCPLPEISEFYASYAHWQVTKQSYVIAKLAVSLDGKIAGISGKPMNLTGEAARSFTHAGRLAADAILTTAKTIHCDDPQLNVRLAAAEIAKPVFIIDRKLSLPLTAKIFTTAKTVTLFHATNADPQKINLYISKGHGCVAITENNTSLNLAEIIAYCGQQGIHELWVEAGGKLFNALLEQNLAQKLYIYIAPKICGSKAVTGFDKATDKLLAYPHIKWRSLGKDCLGEFSK